jgi:hypothetical protein
MDRGQALRRATALHGDLEHGAAAWEAERDPVVRAGVWEQLADWYEDLAAIEHAHDGVVHEAGFGMWPAEVWGGMARLYRVLAATSRCGADGTERDLSLWPALEDGDGAVTTIGLNWLARNGLAEQSLVELVVYLRKRVPQLVKASH